MQVTESSRPWYTQLKKALGPGDVIQANQDLIGSSLMLSQPVVYLLGMLLWASSSFWTSVYLLLWRC